jgi:hypothetical protein
MRHLAACVSLLCLTAGVAAAEDGPWGTLTGQFVFDGDVPVPEPIVNAKVQQDFPNEKIVEEMLLVDPESKGLANVVVYVRTKNVEVNPALKEAVPANVLMDNHHGHFEPRILPVWLGVQELSFGNSDPVGHNSNFQPLGDNAANPLLAPMGMVKHALRKEQSVPQPVSCNIHPWMKAYILPRKNPYVAVSAADGTFTIADMPVGELEFQAWHENPGYLALKGWDKGRFKATIKAGETTDLGVIKVPAAAVKKKT